MTDIGTSAPRPGRAHRSRFRRLEEELRELGFEPDDESTRPGYDVYTATDSPARVTVIDEPGVFPRVRVDTRTGGDGLWGIDWTAGTPTAVQLIALYAALNDDPEGALHGAAAAIGVHDLTALSDPDGAAG